VHFEVEHVFAAPRARVAEVLCDPDFHTHLDLPDLSRPDVVVNATEGTTRVLGLRYEYTGRLDPIARTIVGAGTLTWAQELRLDTVTYVGTLSYSADEDAGRLGGSADIELTGLDGDARTRRRIGGDLRVRITLVGATAERRIVPGLLRRLDVEAAALSKELASRA
jgi:hypothetical protein